VFPSGNDRHTGQRRKPQSPDGTHALIILPALGAARRDPSRRARRMGALVQGLAFTRGVPFNLL